MYDLSLAGTDNPVQRSNQSLFRHAPSDFGQNLLKIESDPIQESEEQFDNRTFLSDHGQLPSLTDAISSGIKKGTIKRGQRRSGWRAGNG